MRQQDLQQRPYPLIDADPHAGRVVRYMRTSDYAAWAGVTAALPAGFLVLERVDPIRTSTRAAMRICVGVGLIGGFLFAYQRSSLRFWGWTENRREYEKDFREMTERTQQGKSLYGESGEPAFVQLAGARNSQNSQLKMSMVPWFNLVNHPYHGVDPAKYGPDAFLSGPPRMSAPDNMSSEKEEGTA